MQSVYKSIQMLTDQAHELCQHLLSIPYINQTYRDHIEKLLREIERVLSLKDESLICHLFIASIIPKLEKMGQSVALYHSLEAKGKRNVIRYTTPTIDDSPAFSPAPTPSNHLADNYDSLSKEAKEHIDHLFNDIYNLLADSTDKPS